MFLQLLRQVCHASCHPKQVGITLDIVADGELDVF